MVINKTVRINSADMTASFAMPYSIRYKKVIGPNVGYMQDGTYSPDVRARKAVITLKPQPLTLNDASALVNACLNDTVSFYYFDVAAKAYKTISAIPSELEVTYAGQTDGGEDRYTITNLVMEEQ